MKQILTFCVALLLCVSSFAQDGKETGRDIWNWSPDKDYHDALVSVECQKWNGTGVLVYTTPIVHGDNETLKIVSESLNFCLIASAAHLFYDVDENEKFVDPQGDELCSIIYKNGVAIDGAKVEQKDFDRDLVIISAICPKEILPVKIAEVSPKATDLVELCGFGGKSEVTKDELRHFFSHVAWTTGSNFILSPSYGLPGDSGGGVFNDKGELVGILSHGINMSSRKITHSSGWEGKLVFPSFASERKHVKALLDKAIESQPMIKNATKVEPDKE